MKKILAGSVMAMLAMSTVHAAITVIGDKEMLEGDEGHIGVYAYPEGNGVSATFEHISGAAVQITVDPEHPSLGTVVPKEVSENTESTIRITVGSETVDHTFKVMNAAEPEQVSGKTIAQCTFYNDYQGHTGIAGTGFFSFDKRTVDKMPPIGTVQHGTDGYTYIQVEQIVSTTRKIDELSFTGFTVFENDGDLRVTDDFKLDNNISEIWYAGSGHHAGQAEAVYRVGRNLTRTWRAGYIQPNGPPFRARYSRFGFKSANDSAAYGLWETSLQYEYKGSGYFACTLSNEEDMSACGGSFDLPSNQWSQIGLPCNPGPGYKSAPKLFKNMPGIYGQDWAMFRYDSRENKYTKLGVDDALSQGEGYWIIQKSGETVTLTMPQGSVPTLTIYPEACTSPKGCVEIPLVTKSGENKWNMIGYPYDAAGVLGDARVTASSGSCSIPAGCNLDTAKDQGIVDNQLWSYVDADTGYLQISASDTLSPWKSYWSLTLSNAATVSSTSIVIPKP